jgi:tetratricopeptide (TPR) repeat protein
MSKKRAPKEFKSRSKSTQKPLAQKKETLSLSQEAGLLSDLFNQGRFEEAEDYARRLLNKHPDWVYGWNILGVCCGELEKYNEALGAFQKVLSFLPNDPNVYNNIGPVFQELGKLTEAVESLQKAVALNPNLTTAHLNLGIALRKQGKLKEAEESLRSAQTLSPDYPEIYRNLALIYEDLGNIEEARWLFEKAITLAPSDPQIISNYAHCRKFKAEDHHWADRLERILSQTEREKDRTHCHFALGKMYDDMGRYGEAFTHYREGNHLERKKNNYHRNNFSTFVDSLIKASPAGHQRSRKWTGFLSEIPVFILGMPRSGTSLVEQIISSHPLVFGAGELEYFNEKRKALVAKQGSSYSECIENLSDIELEEIAAEYLDLLGKLDDKALRVTDKMPSNFIHLGLISLLFPRARVIHCRRNPLDTCLSIFFQNFSNRHPYAYDLGELGHYYGEYERLMGHWRQVIPQKMILEVDYEAVLEKPEEVSRNLIGFCGLDWDDRCLKFHENKRAVRTASFWQVRQPLYKTSKERWRNYEKHLGPLVAELPNKKAGEIDETARLIRSVLKRYRIGPNDEAFIQEILKTDKNIFDTLQMLGIKAGQEGHNEEAEVLIRHAIKINSFSAEAFHNLGIVLMKRGKREEAVKHFRKALELHPDFAMADFNLGNILQQQGKLVEAEESYLRVLELKPGFVEAHLNLGVILEELGKLKEAIKHYQRAIDLKPDSAEAHNNLGNALQELGKLNEAEESYLRALELDPGFALAYKNYASCRKFTEEDNVLVDRLEVLLSNADKEEDRRNLHNALGKIYDDCGRYAAAFRNYKHCNQIERKKYKYRWQDFSTYVDRLIDAFPAGYYRTRPWAGATSEVPLFIVGMPRSGTTLIEQIISSHPLVYGAGELGCLEEITRGLKGRHETSYPECLKILTEDDWGEIVNLYLDFIWGFSGGSLRITDKMPGNFLHLGLVSLLFQMPRVIHCNRSPLDTCLSIFFQRFSGKSHPYSCDLVELGHYYLDYERLMTHWRKVLPTGMMLEIQYEEVIEKPEEMSRKLIAFCGLDWDKRCLKFYENDRKVRTASSWQVRQPLYKTSKERWRNYEKHLTSLVGILTGKRSWNSS